MYENDLKRAVYGAIIRSYLTVRVQRMLVPRIGLLALLPAALRRINIDFSILSIAAG